MSGNGTRRAVQTLLGWVALCLAAVVAAMPAQASEAEARAFYAGKQFRFITMGGPGGGFDTYMRTIAPYLEKYLDVNVLPVNESGAGGLVAMNRLFKEPADGLTMVLIFGSSVINGELYGTAKGRYKVDELVWLARAAATPKVVLFGPKTPYGTFADLLKAGGPIIWGGSGKTDGNSDWASILCHALGIEAKIIAGYKGSRNMMAALERGEIDAQILTDESGKRASMRAPIRAAVTLDRERSARFPDVPTIYEVAAPSQEQAWWFDWRADVTRLGRVLVTKPGVPQDRVAVLRQALEQVFHDRDFLADAQKRRRSINYASGEEVEGIIKRTMASIGKERLDEIRDVVLNKYYTH